MELFFLILLGISLAIFIIIFNLIEKNLLTPINVFISFWLFHILFFFLYLQIIEYKINDVYWFGLLVIFFSIVTVGIGNLIGYVIAKKPNFLINSFNLSKNSLKKLIFLCLLVILLLISLFIMQGKPLPTTLDISDISSTITSARYGGYNLANNNKILAIVSFFTFFLVYYLCLIGGKLFVIQNNLLYKIITLFPIAIAMFAGVYNRGSRMGVLIGIALWLASYFSTLTFLNNQNKKKLSFFSIFFTVFLIFVIGFMLGSSILLVRYGEISNLYLDEFFYSFKDYPASFFAFLELAENQSFFEDSIKYGYHTFVRFFIVLFDIRYPVEIYDVGFTTTNYITVFGELILDFSYLGLILFFLIFGVFGGYCHKKVKNGDTRFVGLLSIFYSYIFMSGAFSVFSFATPLAALIFFSYKSFNKDNYIFSVK